MQPIDESISTPVPQEQIVRSAAIVSVGNILSRIMGLARETVIADLFGAGGAVSAYTAAANVPIMLYDMLVGGMVTSALVPTFSEYAVRGRRDELWHVASLLFTLTAFILGGSVLLLEIGAPWVTRVLVGGFEEPLQVETTRLLRITVISVFFLGLAGIATALCQSLQRFAPPAFTAVVFNASIVITALLIGRRWHDVRVLAVGLVIGATLQLMLQLPALRDMRFCPVVDLRHPALRRIMRLYLPVVLGLVIAQLGIVIDRNLASQTGESSISWMRYATTLIQFPLGLISAAVATATLPTLARRRDDESFTATLADGLRLVLTLTIPAAVGLFVLAHPIVALLFQHGDFDAYDTVWTATALRYYLIGLLCAAVDQPLVFAFYARQDTLRPALVGVLGVGFYLLVALPTMRPLGMIGLILANGAQLGGHMVVMLWLFRRHVGSLRGYGIGQALLKSSLAATIMGGAVYGATQVVATLPTAGIVRWSLTVVVGGGVGMPVYWLACSLLGVREVTMVRSLLTRAMGKH